MTCAVFNVNSSNHRDFVNQCYYSETMRIFVIVKLKTKFNCSRERKREEGEEKKKPTTTQVTNSKDP